MYMEEELSKLEQQLAEVIKKIIKLSKSKKGNTNIFYYELLKAFLQDQFTNKLFDEPAS